MALWLNSVAVWLNSDSHGVYNHVSCSYAKPAPDSHRGAAASQPRQQRGGVAKQPHSHDESHTHHEGVALIVAVRFSVTATQPRGDSRLMTQQAAAGPTPKGHTNREVHKARTLMSWVAQWHELRCSRRASEGRGFLEALT